MLLTTFYRHFTLWWLHLFDDWPFYSFIHVILRWFDLTFAILGTFWPFGDHSLFLMHWYSFIRPIHSTMMIRYSPFICYLMIIHCPLHYDFVIWWRHFDSDGDTIQIRVFIHSVFDTFHLFGDTLFDTTHYIHSTFCCSFPLRYLFSNSVIPSFPICCYSLLLVFWCCWLTVLLPLDYCSPIPFISSSFHSFYSFSSFIICSFVPVVIRYRVRVVPTICRTFVTLLFGDTIRYIPD